MRRTLLAVSAVAALTLPSRAADERDPSAALRSAFDGGPAAGRPRLLPKAPAIRRVAPALKQAAPPDARRWVRIPARNKFERTAVADAGVAIEVVKPEYVEGVADPAALKLLSERGILIQRQTPLNQIFTEDFPPKDAVYHDYDELKAALAKLAAEHADIASVFSIGQSHQGRDLLGVRLSAGASEKPGAFFVGTHHAREHLSTEVPLLLAQHLAANKKDPAVERLLRTREVFIVPMLNPDGVQEDIRDAERRGYKWQRKNMRDNRDGTFGVDLNRNYDFRFGGPGASDRTSSDVYHGPSAFSEPESRAVKAFLDSHPKVKVLLSYHTFSELVMYPWGGAYEPVPNEKHHAAFKKMAETMAGWNGYTPQQSSELYIATGDTCDWAYGSNGVFAFTFELTPKSGWMGGFYPGPDVIAPTFTKNLQPALYLIELADDPLRVLDPS